MGKILIICGQTSTGKTALAIALAKKFNGELVNADSQQVYQDLDALTGKDRSLDVPIHLYDVVSPDQEFSVAHFVRLAQTAIDDIHKRTKLPIVVGGTGFYLRALTEPVETLSIPPNEKLRKQLANLALDELQAKLKHVDKSRWDNMNDSDRKNPRRLIRAIEVALSAKPKSSATPRYDVLWIGLSADKEALKQRITKRVAKRFDRAVSEVREGLPPILGAEPLLSFKKGTVTKEAALKHWAHAEYQYAKRQRLWFKKQQDIHWFDVTMPSYAQKVETLVRSWYTSKCDDQVVEFRHALVLCA